MSAVRARQRPPRRQRDGLAKLERTLSSAASAAKRAIGRGFAATDGAREGATAIHTHRPKPPLALPLPPPATDPRTERLKRLGAITISVWYLGGFALATVLLLAEVGPLGAMSGWLSRTLGYDNPLLAFLPFFALLATPVIVLQLMPLSANVFIRGAQETFRPRPTGIIGPTTLARRMKRGAIVCYTLAGVFALAGGMGFLLLARAPPDAGRPLPALTAAQLVARRESLPRYARLSGAPMETRPVWLRVRTTRSATYADAYFPIDRWGGTDPARLLGLQEQRVAPEGHGPDLSLMLPADGALSVERIPSWRRERMAAHGITVTDPIILFTILPDLHGRYPGADMIDAWFVLILGGVFAALCCLIATIFVFKRRAILREVAGDATRAAHNHAVAKLHRDAGL